MESIWQWGLSVILWIQHYRVPALDAAMRWFTFMGDEEFYLLLLPFLAWCIDFGMGLRVGAIFLLSVLTNGALKDTLLQPRPFDLNPGVKLAEAEGYGLPSGHAQSAAVVWGSLGSWTRNIWIWLLAISAIALVGLSRVYLGVHFPTDVLAGWAIGIALLAIFLTVLPSALTLARRLGLGAQLAAALVLPVVLAWLHPTKDAVSAMGTLAGLGIGLAFTWRFVPFSSLGPWWQRAARFLIGAIVALAIYLGLRGLFPGQGSPLFFTFRFLRYGLIGTWVAFGAPWLFLKLRLAPIRGRY
jgi:undecaprenyl-diphosphatase